MRRGYFTFYNEWDNNSLLFHLFFFNLTFSCPHSYHLMLTATCMCRPYLQGRIQDFKLEGALKRIAPSGGRRENVRVFRVKNHDFTPKNHIFPNFRGGAPGAPPLDPPLSSSIYMCSQLYISKHLDTSCTAYISARK